VRTSGAKAGKAAINAASQRHRQLLEQWMKDQPRRGHPLFPSIRGDKMSRAAGHLVRKHGVVASASCATLVDKRISPHVLEHSTAMGCFSTASIVCHRALARP
jgi:integrase